MTQGNNGKNETSAFADIEPQVKAAMDKFIVALFPLVGEFYATKSIKPLPEFHISLEGRNIRIAPHFLQRRKRK
ncbi:hypothetical protein FACS1894211_06750 [Clostridia bacterium]|nr:hypothetical protein FACS1894211_06750 [Clostridia bacterium]